MLESPTLRPCNTTYYCFLTVRFCPCIEIILIKNLITWGCLLTCTYCESFQVSTDTITFLSGTQLIFFKKHTQRLYHVSYYLIKLPYSHVLSFFVIKNDCKYCYLIIIPMKILCSLLISKRIVLCEVTCIEKFPLFQIFFDMF